MQSNEVNNNITGDEPKRFTVLSGLHRGASTICPPQFSLGGTGSEEILLKDTYFKDKTIIFVENHTAPIGFDLSVPEDAKALEIEVAQSGTRFFLKSGDINFIISGAEDELNDINLDEIEFSSLIISPFNVNNSENTERKESEHTKEAHNDTLTEKHQGTAESSASQTDLEENKASLEIETSPKSDKYLGNLTTNAEQVEKVSMHTSDTHQNRYRWINRASIASLLLISIFLGSILAKMYVNKKQDQTIQTPSAENCLNKIQNEIKLRLGYPLKVIKVKDPDEHYFYVTGTVTRLDKITPLFDEINETGCTLKWRLISMAEAIAEVDQFLVARHGNQVTATGSAENNRIVLSGFVASEESWHYSNRTINTMLEGEIALDDQVKFTSNVKDYMEQLLIEHKLSGYVLLSVSTNNLLIANMVFQPDLLDKFETIHRKYKRRFPLAPDIEIKEINLGQLGIRAVSISNSPRVVLSNGQTYLIGSIFPNGAILSAIEADAITLKTSQGIVKYPVFQSAMNRAMKTSDKTNTDTTLGKTSNTNQSERRQAPAKPQEKISWNQSQAKRQHEDQGNNDKDIFNDIDLLSDFFIEEEKTKPEKLKK